MTTPTRMRTRQSRRPDNSPAADEDRAAKALATADAIGQRVNSLIRHLASLNEQQLQTVAEPVLESLATAVAGIHQLHTLFAGWATDHPDSANQAASGQDTDRLSTGSPGGAPTQAQVAANGSDRALAAISPNERRQTEDPAAPPLPPPACASEPASPATPLVAALGDQQPAKVTSVAIAQLPAAGTATSGQPAPDQPPQHTPLDTVDDLARWLTAVSSGTPIRLHHDDTAYLLRLHHTDGRLVLTIAQPDS